MVMGFVYDVGAVLVVPCAVPAQADRIGDAAKAGSDRVARLCVAGLARLFDKGARNLPATEQRVNQSPALVEDRQTVDVVSLKDLTAIVTGAALVILQVPWVVQSFEIV